MRHKRLRPFAWVLALTLGGLVAALPAGAVGVGDAGTVMVPANFTRLAEIARPAVVNIRTVKTVNGGGPVFRHFFERGPFGDQDPFREFFGRGPMQEFKQRSLGSGFIVDASGFIVTNNHVVEDADQIKVRLYDEKEYDAEVVGRDPKTDLALIRIKADRKLEALPLGDSDQLPVGSWVLAIGSPFGLEQTVTAGIVSAKGRIIGTGPYDDFIQTDASINPGNSGGPLVNLQGEVVGINTAIVASGQGIGFAIPVNLARGIIAQLKDTGEVSRGWLGVGIQNLTPELIEYYGLKEDQGALVTQVYEGDPADRAGIRPGDVIVGVEDTPVASSRDLSSAIANAGAGSTIKVQLRREGKDKTVQVKLSKRSETEPGAVRSEKRSDDLGLQVGELTPELAERLGLDASQKGVVVMQVESGSKAEEAGIERGDVISEINRRVIDDLAAYGKVMDGLKAGDTVQMLLRRGGGGLVAVKFIR
jgi:serine protease Do